MIRFSESEVKRFRHNNKALRWGQAFHQFMKLEKVSNENDKAYCDRIYNADEELAKALVASRIDKNQ